MVERTEADWSALMEEEFIERARTDYQSAIWWLDQCCESPIERVFVRALYLEKPQGFRIFRTIGDRPFPIDNLMQMIGVDHYRDWVGAIYAQMPIEPYRADFYIEVFDTNKRERWFTAVIECDGHDFHERTKEQARRDKQRDRWFQTRGIATIRFTGSEIWNDPIKCAEDAYEVFWQALARHTGVAWRPRR